jgi:hypothetical protein
LLRRDAAFNDLLVESIDLGIRYGGSRYPGLVVEKLFDDAWLVVCAPALARRVRRLAGLRRVPHLHDDEPDGWATWLAKRGVRELHLGQGRELTDSAMVVDAAIRGQGVALVRWSLAADALAQGRLIQPFPRCQAGADPARLLPRRPRRDAASPRGGRVSRLADGRDRRLVAPACVTARLQQLPGKTSTKDNELAVPRRHHLRRLAQRRCMASPRPAPRAAHRMELPSGCSACRGRGRAIVVGPGLERLDHQ